MIVYIIFCNSDFRFVASHNALGNFEQGIAAGEKAIQLNPSLQIARNNVEYARRQLQNRK